MTTLLNVSTDKPNPIHTLFSTTMLLDYMDVPLDLLEMLPLWVRSKNWENLGWSPTNCTQDGDQFNLNEKCLWDYKEAPGVAELEKEIKPRLDHWVQTASGQPHYCATAEWFHFVFYKEHGFQTPHVHRKHEWTAIVGLRNNGTVLLYDPRPTAVAMGSHMFYKEVIINPGQICITPGYLAHSSIPCYHKDGRDILVINGT